jgi:hypothetical protein
MGLEFPEELSSSQENTESNAEVDPMRNEHLTGEARPIIASLSTDKYRYAETYDPITRKVFDEDAQNAELVSFYKDQNYLEEQGMLNAGEQSYVISQISEKPKYSFEYHNCTGIAISATDIETGNQISFLSHQNPGSFLPWYKLSAYKFDGDLSARIQEIRARAVPGSIDAVVFGGNMRKNGKEYEDSISVLAGICKRNLGFEPVVIAGPSIPEGVGGGTEVYLDTEHRRLQIARPIQEGDATNKSFVPSQVGDRSKELLEDWKIRKQKDN